MKKLALFLMLWAMPALCQVSRNFPALDTTNVYSGTNIFNGPVTFGQSFVVPTITAGTINTTGDGLIMTFKTQLAPTVPQTGFMEWYGDSVTNKWTCLNPDGSSCAPTSSGSLTISTNGVNNTSQSVLNFINPATFNGLTFTYSNPGGAGNQTFALGGTLGNAGLTNSATTVNGQTCTLGSTCTVSGSAPTVVAGSSDTLTAAGVFATQTSLTAGSTSFFEIRAHGVYSTTATATPIEHMRVNAFGTTGICQYSGGNNSLNTNLTNLSWDVVCYVHILTTGAPGTATAWGLDTTITTIAGLVVDHGFSQNAATVAATTTTAQTISIEETATLVAGESFTLQSLIVRAY